MANKIRLLPDAIANQIAAGEVVQRPASVVKELMENAVDAGSTHITVIIKDAGKTLIQVVDNGHGMSASDARLCFERHATSKIRSTQDLFAIRTMGFRGEAMASIAAVAQVELKTRQEEDEVGVCMRIEGSAFKGQEPTACAVGTQVSVKNLFFNVPARRNFLKSNPVETRHILDEFQRVALAYPEIRFSLFQNDLETFRLTDGKLGHRITGLFGANYKEQLVPCAEETSLVKITGYVGTPSSAKKTRGEQFFFANNRFIKNSYLHHAVITAFEGLIPDGTHPFYVLNLDIDPVHIDINVHPTKTEIKFDDDRSVYAVVMAAVRQALGKFNISPSLDFDMDVNFPGLASGGGVSTGVAAADSAKNFPSTPRFSTGPVSRSAADAYGSMWTGSMIGAAFGEREEEQPLQAQFTIRSSAHTSDHLKNEPREQESMMLVHDRFLLAQVKSGLMLIHREAAMQRILYEKFLQDMEEGKGSSQQLLFPEQVQLNASDFALVESMKSEIKAMGFDFEVFGRDSLQLLGVPAAMDSGNAKETFEGLIEQFKSFKDTLSLDNKENLARSLAKRTASRNQPGRNPAEWSSLIDRLFACKNPNFSPEGKRTFVLMDMNRLQSLLNTN
jgi:DNA mismatch repair protein MutL